MLIACTRYQVLTETTVHTYRGWRYSRVTRLPRCGVLLVPPAGAVRVVTHSGSQLRSPLSENGRWGDIRGCMTLEASAWHGGSDIVYHSATCRGVLSELKPVKKKKAE